MVAQMCRLVAGADSPQHSILCSHKWYTNRHFNQHMIFHYCDKAQWCSPFHKYYIMMSQHATYNSQLAEMAWGGCVIYQSPLILTELFQHNLINVSYLTACYLYQVMMTLHFLNDIANDAESTQK